MTDSPHLPWRFACQARPWIQTLGLTAFRHGLPTVMQHIAGIGFTGFETALPALPLGDPDTFAEWRASAGGIELAAAHTGGNWWDPDTAATVPSVVEQLSRLPALGCNRLMVSIGGGVTELDAQGLEQMCRTVRTLGQGAAQHGVEIAIHNHAHELKHGARVLRAILDYTEPDQVSLGADIGWVVQGGWDAVEFIDTFGDRMTYLHVRDVTSEDALPGFIEVGRGSMHWSAIASKLQEIGFSGWLTAESEFSDLWQGMSDPLETTTAQYDGMSRRIQLTG